MLSKPVQDSINEQIKNELFSAYLYLSMSAYLAAIRLPGFAHWTRVQADEEVAHAMRLFDFVNTRGGRVLLQAIDQPASGFQSPLDVARQTLEHEQKVSQMIYDLYEVAAQQKDYATQSMLQWFISEQVEEEKSAADLVDKLNLIGEDRAGLFVLDRELAGREAE